MTRLGLTLVLWGLATSAGAQDWQPMTGPEITAALDDRTLIYDDTFRQVFYKSGKTLYDNGRPSWGNWAVRGQEYCSEWPPADGWTCYRMERHADNRRVRFVSQTGHVTVGSYLE